MATGQSGSFKFLDPSKQPVQKPKFVRNKYLLAMHRNHGEMVGYSLQAELRKQQRDQTQ